MLRKILIVLALIEACCCFPNATSACKSMTPGHKPFKPKLSAPPYWAILDPTIVKSNEGVEITITGITAFKGFFIEIRNDSGIAVGHFDVSESNGEAETLDCFGDKANAASQSARDDKTSVNFRWVSPDAPGIYTVYLTMVKNYGTFWVTKTNIKVTVI